MDLAVVKPTPAVFVSPHFDDVALSCGGTASIEAASGGALAITVFAGQPPGQLNSFATFQHQRWGHPDDAVDERRREDTRAMASLGLDFVWLDERDAIYRDNLYLTDDDLFGDVKPGDAPVRAAVARSVADILDRARPERVYLPLGVGNHVDHQICTRLGRMVHDRGASVLFYEDIPYAVTPGAVDLRRERLGFDVTPVLKDVGEAIETRIAAIHCYESQLPTIFRHYGPADDVIRSYARSLGANGYVERFWRPAF